MSCVVLFSTYNNAFIQSILYMWPRISIILHLNPDGILCFKVGTLYAQYIYYSLSNFKGTIMYKFMLVLKYSDKSIACK